MNKGRHKYSRKIKSLVRRLLPHAFYFFIRRSNYKSIQSNIKALQRIPLDKAKKTYVFWSHDAGLTYHLISLSVIAKTLKTLGHQVLMISCGGELERCTVKDGHDLPLGSSQKKIERFCLDCQRNGLTHFEQYDLPSMQMATLVSRDQAAQAKKHLQGFKGEIKDYVYDSISFGQIALGEVIRLCKLNSEALTSDYLKIFTKKHIQAAVYIYLAFENLRRTLKIGKVIFFGDYGNVLGLVKSCTMHQIPMTNLSHTLLTNVQRMRITMMHALSTADQFWRLSHWEHWKSKPLSQQQVSEISEDVLFRFHGQGFTIFSPNKTQNSDGLFEKLNLSTERKLIVAYTSSLDEALSTQLQYSALGVTSLPKEKPFVDQVDWLLKLAEYIENSDNLQLVVRIHPRESTDGYKIKASEQLLRYQKALSGDYQHVRIVWPQDDVSSYDLGEIADCVATAWTSIGLELARLGVPVLCAFQYCPYPYGDFIYFQPRKEDYFTQLEKLVDTPSSLASIISAYRWFYIARFSHSVDVGDIDRDSDFTSLPRFKMPERAKDIEKVIVQNEHMSILNMNNQLGNQALEESKAIKHVLKTTILRLLGLPEKGKLDLRVVSESDFEKVNHKDCVVFCFYSKRMKVKYQETLIEKYSPMLSRLVLLIADHTMTLSTKELEYGVL